MPPNGQPVPTWSTYAKRWASIKPARGEEGIEVMTLVSPWPGRAIVLRALCIIAVQLCSGCLIDQIGGAFTQEPEQLEQTASDPTKKLIDQAFDGIDPARLVDFEPYG